MLKLDVMTITFMQVMQCTRRCIVTYLEAGKQSKDLVAQRAAPQCLEAHEGQILHHRCCCLPEPLALHMHVTLEGYDIC